MKKIALAATAATFALVGAAQAQTQPEFYVNGGVAYLDNADIWGVQARAGVNLGAHFGFEAEGVIGLNDTTFGPATVELDRSLGAFARLRHGLGDNLEGFVRAGVASIKTSSEVAGVTTSFTEEEFALGAGVEYFFNANNGVRVDYTNYGVDSNGHSGALSYVFRF